MFRPRKQEMDELAIYGEKITTRNVSSDRQLKSILLFKTSTYISESKDEGQEKKAQVPTVHQQLHVIRDAALLMSMS